MTILTVTFDYEAGLRKRQEQELKETDAPEEVRRNIRRLMDQEKEGVMRILEEEGVLEGLSITSETRSSIVVMGTESQLMKLHEVIVRYELGRMFNDAEGQDNEYYPWLGDDNQFFSAGHYADENE